MKYFKPAVNILEHRSVPSPIGLPEPAAVAEDIHLEVILIPDYYMIEMEMEPILNINPVPPTIYDNMFEYIRDDDRPFKYIPFRHQIDGYRYFNVDGDLLGR